MRLESPDVPLDAYVAKLAERGGIVEQHVSGAEVRSPSVQLRVLPRRRRRAALDARPAAGWPVRPELPRREVPGRLRLRPRHLGRGAHGRSPAGEGGRARPVRHRLRRGPSGRRRLGRLRDRDQPPQGRHDPPVPDPAVPDRRAVRRRHRPVPDPGRRRAAPGGHRSPRVTRRCAGSASTTCSTSWRGTACTSTRPARPGSSCT